jgi:hypothetical protein
LPAPSCRWGTLEGGACTQLDDASIINSHRRVAGQPEADVPHHPARLAERLADMFRPPPSRLVGDTTERQPADANQIEPAFDEFIAFVWRVKQLEYYRTSLELESWFAA